MVGAVVVGGAVVAGGVVVGGLVARGVVVGLPLGDGEAVGIRAVLPPGLAVGAGGRAGAVRVGGGTAVADGVTAVVGDAGGAGGGGFSSAVASTNGMTVSGVIGPPAKLIPTSTV
ncbi:GTPase [Micromonospora sp. RP3T]|nr:GTPase [Micromonospora sp. RP3T]